MHGSQATLIVTMSLSPDESKSVHYATAANETWMLDRHTTPVARSIVSVPPDDDEEGLPGSQSRRQEDVLRPFGIIM
jgi:hypothetical protein